MVENAAGPMARDERIRIIAERKELPGRGQPVFLGGRYRFFPIAQIPIETLIYRLDNGRLAAEVEEYAAARRITVDALRDRAESRALQEFLHGALLRMAHDPQGPIFAELERLAQQTEPLLILFDGIVVNGNRRLSAMRDLLRHDPDRYGGFRLVDVAVLPEGTKAREVEYVEASLQMAPETKLAYGWIDRRLKLRKQRDVLRLPIDEIMAAYRIDEARQIDCELAELALAEDYLRAFRGEPAHYSAIADAGELFIGLREQLACVPEDRTLFWRNAGFAMIEGRDADLQKRLEQLFPFAAPVSPEIPATAQIRLAQRLDVGGTDDLADEGALAPGAAERLLAIVRDRQRSAANAKLIADILDELRLEHSERNAPERMLQRMRQAGKLIAGLQPERLSAAQRRRLRVELAALMAHGSFLLGEMDEKPAAPMTWIYSKPIVRPPYWKVPWRLARRFGLAPPPRGK
jgi:hypothetical protein